MGELQGAGGYRVGDADRNRTADLLKEAHAAGYLSLEEVDERLGTALAARTRGELDRLVADLPPEWRASQQPAPPAARPPRQRPAFPPEAVWLVPLLVVVAGVLTLAVLTRGLFFPWPLLFIFLAFGRRRAGWRPPRW
jgi:Domain of unknown function (DUF1707)